MALPAGTKCGPVWRIAPCGTRPVYYAGRLFDSGCKVFSEGSRTTAGRWAKSPLVANIQDLFVTRSEALAEYRARRARAIAEYGLSASLNLTTKL